MSSSVTNVSTNFNPFTTPALTPRVLSFSWSGDFLRTVFCLFLIHYPNSAMAALLSSVSTMVALQLCAVFNAAIAGPAMASISLQDGAMPSRSGNRFLLDSPNSAASGGGRRSLLNYNACGSGSAPDYECKSRFPAYKNSTCCTQADNSKQCYDVGGFLNNMCGS